MTAQPDRARDRRRRTHDAGQAAELLALILLTLKGYRVLARRFAVNGGEIDLVARRGNVVAFVEVKARPTVTAASEALSPRKQRRIEKAAAVWLARHPWAMRMTLRGDAILVLPRTWPRHIPAAFALRIG